MEQEKIWDYFQGDALYAFDGARARYETIVRVVTKYAGKNGKQALNIGIGAGGVEQGLSALRWKVSSLDPSDGPVARMRELGVDAHSGLAQAMPFQSGAFDAVIASEVLEHIPRDDRVRALDEVARVLKPRGVFVGSVPYREALQDSTTVCPACGNVFHRWGHVDSFDRAALRRDFAGRFDLLVCRPLAFVSWRSVHGLKPLAKTAFKWLLGRMGEPIVSPSLLFVARRL